MKKNRHIIFSIIALTGFLMSSNTAIAQNPKAHYGTFAFVNAQIQTVTKGIIPSGTVVISKGKIISVGNSVTIPPDAEVIDCKGLTIYPGMIDSGTKIGLTEVGSDPRTQDYEELGDIVPQMKTLTAVNPNATAIAVTRISGVTTALATPDGGVMPGTAALVNLFGYTPDQMFAGFEGIVINWPNTRRRMFDRRSEEDIKKQSEKEIEKLSSTWDKAVEFRRIDSALQGKGVAYYPEMTALEPAVTGKVPLLIEVNFSKDILAALQWIKDKKIKKAILTGVAEGWRVAEEIAKAGIPVIAGPVLAVPSREYDRYDKAYANPGLMKKAGIKVALKTEDGNTNYRNLPYHAGFAAAYGLGKEEALRSVTIVPAEMLGVEKMLGSIEVGKNATLFIADGDPFETKTQIKNVFIDGWQMPLVSRQTLLNDEFLKRDPGVNKN